MKNIQLCKNTVKRVILRKKIQRMIVDSCPWPAQFVSARVSLDRCADVQVWQYFLDESNPHLHRAWLCGQPKLCPLCAKILSVRRFYNVQEWLSSRCPESGSLYNVTLTVRDGESLNETRERLHFLRLKIVEIRKLYKIGKYQNYSELMKFSGYFLKEEIKRGKDSGLYHPHFHGLFYSSQRVDYEAFRQEINSLDGDNHSNKITLMRRDDVKGILEAVKYVHKFSSDPAFICDIWDIFKSTYHQRIFFKYGSFIGLDEEKEVLISPEKKVAFYQLLAFLGKDEIPTSEIMSVSDYAVKCPDVPASLLEERERKKQFRKTIPSPYSKKDINKMFYERYGEEVI